MRASRPCRLLAAAACMLTLLVAPMRAAAQEKAIVDVDMGVLNDDAVALFMLLNSPNVEVLGVTVVPGNTWMENGTAYSLRQLELIGRTDVPVFMGVREPLARFIRDQLGPLDMIGVMYPLMPVSMLTLTRDHESVIREIERFEGRKFDYRPRNTFEEQYSMYPAEIVERVRTQVSLSALEGLAVRLGGLREGRKAVVLVSEGYSFYLPPQLRDPVAEMPGLGNPARGRPTLGEGTVAEERKQFFDSADMQHELQQVYSAANRANTAIYTLDPRGLAVFEFDLGENVGTGFDRQALQATQDTLRTIAEETDGRAIVNRNDLEGGLRQVVRDTSAYYLLGYNSTQAPSDGKFHEIKVRVKRPGLQVRARKGYVAPKGKAEPRFTTTDAGTAAETSAVLREALNSPLPEPDLPMGVTAAAFKGTLPNASVVVVTQLGGRQLSFTQQDGKFLNTIELSMIAIDAQGKIRNGDRSKIDLALSPQTHQAVLAGGFRMLTRLDLPPGRYQLRLAARESGGLVGSLPYDLVVPDFSKEPMSISGLVITSLSSAMTPTARSDEQLKDVLPGPPSVMRDFVQGDTLSLFAEVYDNDTKSPHRVDILTTLIGEDGRQAFKIEDERNSSELQGSRGGYGYTAKIPLADVAPGRYLLRVEARSRLRSDAPVSRETEIRVYQVRRPASPSASAAPAGRAIVPVELGPMSGVNEYREVIARTPDEWADLWKSLPVRRAMPKVTFESTMIAGLFLGERSSAGYGVEFTAVKRDGDTLVIEYVEREPGADTTAAQMITTPFFIAGVPKHDGPVKFVRVEP